MALLIYLFFSSCLCVDRAYSCSILFPAAVKKENVNRPARHFTEEEHTLSLINLPFLQPRLMRQRWCRFAGRLVLRISHIWGSDWEVGYEAGNDFIMSGGDRNTRTQSPSNQIISKLPKEVSEGRRVMRSADMIGGQSLHRNPLAPLPSDYLAQQFHVPR